MWPRVKPLLSRFVLWSIKNHWLLLILVISLQFVSGKILSGALAVNLPRPTVFAIHSTLGLLIFIIAILMTLAKLFLWLMKKGKL